MSWGCYHLFSIPTVTVFVILNFHPVLNVVVFSILRDSPASEFYVLTFRNTLSVPSSQVVFLLKSPIKMEPKDCPETSEHKIQAPGNNPKERIQQFLVY